MHLEISDTDQIASTLRLWPMGGELAMAERLSYPLDVDKHILTFDTDSGSIYRHPLDSGVDTVYATCAIGTASTNEEGAALLKIQVGVPLLRVRRHALTLDEVPIEASDGCCLAGKVDSSVTAVRGNVLPIPLQVGGGVQQGIWYSSV